MKRVRLYLDYISSNAYLAWKVLPELAAKYGARVEPVPVLFAGLLEAHGQLGPAEIPAKMSWMIRNNLRKAALLGIPLNPPAFHPYNPLLSLRISSLPLADDERARLISGLFDAVWVRGLHVSEPDVVRRIADECRLDGARLLEEAGTDGSKARLRQQTDDAIAAGIFGVPMMEVDDERFFGYDDLPYLELQLAGKDPLDPEELRKWTGRPRKASAMRRQRTEKS